MNYMDVIGLGVLRMYSRQSKSMEQGVRSVPRDDIRGISSQIRGTRLKDTVGLSSFCHGARRQTARGSDLGLCYPEKGSATKHVNCRGKCLTFFFLPCYFVRAILICLLI